ncbi:hypothetical protein DPMN_057773 [Dreissena polymorpha]|uniref:Uncharacterized protein n=1 Tax=Dreissena polymorpha TaxID=45954 RepID=A0A9D4HET1_DREPO|nr:hypothetical protein DPMN_057773 [Dreissena polymorpha]
MVTKRLYASIAWCTWDMLFFVFLFVYFVAGMLFMKFGRGAVGTEVIPNYGFWSSLPGLIKEGVAFTCSGCKADTSYAKI